jgi:hypothetical protein
LGFIQNHGLLFELAQEASGIFGSEGALVGVFQGEVPVVWEDGSDEGGLAGLAGPGEQYDRVLSGRAPQLPFQMTLDHDDAPFGYVCKFTILW